MTLVQTKPTVTSALTDKEIAIITAAFDHPHEAIRSLVTNDLFAFLKYFWPEYSDDTFKPNWHIEYICRELEKVARRVSKGIPKKHDLIINVPPGSTKTAIVGVMFPLWCWVNWHWMRFITASYTSPLALETAEYSRDIMRSDKWREIFPNLAVMPDKDTKSNYRIVKYEGVEKKRGGNRFSTSVGGTVTGFHGHINIVDDPIDPMRAVSEVEIKKANHWMDNTLPFRKVDKKVTVTILIMQRLHQDDPTGHLLREKKTTIKHICLPGEIRNYKQMVSPPKLLKKYSENGLLDTVRLDWQVLDELLRLGQFTYGGQVGQNPIPPGGGMFKIDHIPRINQAPNEHLISKTVRYWDKAGTAGDGAYTVGVKMCKLKKDNTLIILDVKRGQWSSEEREKIIRNCAIADGKNVRVWIEQEPGSGGKESAEATVRNLIGFSVGKDRPTGNKEFRADPFSVQVNEGQVQMVTADWNAVYVDELENFPNSTFKDQTDASSGAFHQLISLKEVKVARRGKGR